MKRAFSLVVAIMVLAAGLALLGLAERNLWRAVPNGVLDRYAFDRALPLGIAPPVEMVELWDLCARPQWMRGWWTRQALADCLSEEPSSLTNIANIETLHARWQEAVDAQVTYAAGVRGISSERLLVEMQKLRVFKKQIQIQSGGPFLQLLETRGLVLPERLPEQLDEHLSASDPLKSVALFESSSDYTRGRQDQIREEQKKGSPTGSAAWLAARDIGMLAAGLKLEYDNAAPVKPRPHLATDRESLASRLDWSRRAQPRAGEPLERALTGWLAMIGFSALVAVCVAAILGASPLIVAGLFLFAGVGSLHLMDLALTGPAPLRHLHTRDFGEGFANLFGLLGGFIWGPTLVFLLALLVAKLATNRPLQPVVVGLLMAPLRRIGIGIVLVAALVWCFPMSSALRTEVLGFIAAAGGSIFIARYAPLLGGGASLRVSFFALPVIFSAVLAGVLSAIARVDPLGTLGVLILACLVVGVLLSKGWILRLALFLTLLAILAVYGHFLATGDDVTGVLGILPNHGRIRFLATHDRLAYGMPDVAQVDWLIRSALNPESPAGWGHGWGFGHVPWGGFSPDARSQLPVSAASDLSFLLLGAVGGATCALAMVAALVALLILLIHRGLARALGSEVPMTTRFVCACGAIGLLASVLRSILNLAGALQVAPLAGLPMALISHAPAASIFTLAYCGLVMGSGQSSSARESWT